VERDGDTFAVQSAAKTFAQRLGFPHLAATEIAIVASELTSNVLKYGVRGSLVLEHIDDPARGVRVTAYDEGPPFANFEIALRDGSDDQGPLSPAAYGRRRGIGRGLGAVCRMSDAVGWSPEPHGKRVWAVRYLMRGPRS
jgi:anti-sigma regulatory factor (Ser/Thr protein kinase)